MPIQLVKKGYESIKRDFKLNLDEVDEIIVPTEEVVVLEEEER